jgi:hypothetical protein
MPVADGVMRNTVKQEGDCGSKLERCEVSHARVEVPLENWSILWTNLFVLLRALHELLQE